MQRAARRDRVNEIDPRRLRDALGRFATGITVVTTMGPDERPMGLTANSFAAVSLDPPLVLWSLSREAPSFPVFERAEHFAVNVLSASHRHLSNVFAKPSPDKFSEVDWREGLGRAPLLADPLACFECSTHATFDGGDHLVFVGRVERFAYRDDKPLVFYAGHYVGAGDLPEPERVEDEAADFKDLLL